MKRLILATTLIMMMVIPSLWAQEPENKEAAHFGQIESIYCNADVAPEGQATIPVQFQAVASKGHRAGDLVAVDKIVGIMRFVPATGPDGFVQGSPTSEPGRAADETQFTHILTRNLAVMETEVTRSMWNALKALQPNLINDPTDSSYGSGPDNPVQHVYWGYAAIFANLLSIQNGLVPCYYTDNTKNIVVGRDTTTAFPCYCDFNANGYRLPTEGEWEYFTRAGTTTPLSIAEKKSWNRTQPPDYFPAPNPWHLKHIYGNVWEWCWDRYGTYPTGTVTDYRGADTGNELIYRGGAFDVPTDGCRSARREKYYSRDQKIGFRLVRTL